MQHIIDNLREAVSICQCAEDASTEKHIRLALGAANGSILAVIMELEYMQSKADGKKV